MRSISGCVKRGLLCTAIVGVASAVIGVASAGATITQTSITSPSSPWLYQYNANATTPATVTISGTTNSTAPGTDAVDINCYYSYDFGSLSYYTVASNVVTNADGTFSKAVSPSTEETCLLRAVPHGYGTGYPLTPFAPISTQLDYLVQSPVTGSPVGSTGPFYDYYYSATSSAAYDDYDSVGGCGLDYQYSFTGSSQQQSEYGGWDCAGALYGSDGSGQRTEILIDGKNAYDSYGADHAYIDTIPSGGSTVRSGQAPGFPALTSSYTKDPSTGNVTITESEGLVSCADASYPATEAKCGGTSHTNIGSWQSDGVSFSRTISQTAGGRIVTMTDTYKSTDGAAHQLDLEYENYNYLDGDTTWQLPGSSFSTYSPGDTPSLPAGSENVIYGKDGYYPDPNPYDTPDALIYYSQPNSVSFRDYQTLLLDYQRTVPAGGSVTISHTFITGPDLPTTQKLANSVLDASYKPAVSITGPANNTISQVSSVQVSGTASAHDGLTLKVNGESVGVNPDGTWSTALALNQGANTITAVATDGSGNAAQAAETVYYVPPTTPSPTQSFCIVPNVAKMTMANAKKALQAAHCVVGRISQAKSKTIKKGRVIHAAYSASQVLAYGTRVGLTMSSGKPKKKHLKKHTLRHGPLHR